MVHREVELALSSPPLETFTCVYRQLPNQLTVLRLLLAGVFFVVLNLYRYRDTNDRSWVLLFCFCLFLVAVMTDVLDGYLARRWKVESTFGRIMDPFVDKVLIIGAFIYLAGPRFVDTHAGNMKGVFSVVPDNMITGVYPWMVALILARELLVTSVRGELESMGVQFAANVFGKLKMFLQSATIATVLMIIWLDPWQDGHGWMLWLRDIVVYATVIVTILSGVPYITGATKALKIKRS